MKIHTLMVLGALALVPVSLAACDEDKPEGDADDSDSGASDVAIEALKAQIAELEDELARASEEERAGLEAELAALRERLAALESCANGGYCDGLTEVSDLNALTDAYCDWVFGCCSDSEVRATLGNAAGDVDECKKMYSGLFERGNTTPYAPGLHVQVGANAQEIGQIAESIQRNMVALNPGALESCAQELRSQACGDAEPRLPSGCEGEAPKSSCETILLGLQDEGESCREGACKSGLVCRGISPATTDGVCMRTAASGDYCQEQSDCVDDEGDLFCDLDAGVCRPRAARGEECMFTDPTFDQLPTSDQIVPCQAASYCSAQTGLCAGSCEFAQLGDLCGSEYECGDLAYCDKSDPAVSEMSQVGVCKAKLGAGVTTATAELCLSQSAYMDGVLKCSAADGEACDFSLFGGADCSSGSCRESDEVCRAACLGKDDCADEEDCVSGVCYEGVPVNDPCVVDEQCPESQFCDSGTCADKGALGSGCEDASECTDGFACVNESCHPRAGLPGGGYCEDWFHCESQRCDTSANTCLATEDLVAEGVACSMSGTDPSVINEDPCKPGLYCKRSYPGSLSDWSGVCSTQLQPGQSCDRSLSNQVNQCVGNVPCGTNLATGSYSCPVVYSTPDEHVACVLPVFRVETADGNSGTGGPTAD